MSVLHDILEHRIVAILRGMPPEDTLRIAGALYNGGIRILEITLNSKNALSLIEQLCEAYKDRMRIGAGTVIDRRDAMNAIDAGAEFLISPALDREVIAATKEAGLVSIPGALTPTEILEAHRQGADIVKVFPCPDAAYIKNVLAPLDHIRLMPTGGIDTSNIKTFAGTGAVAFGIGSALVGKTTLVDDQYLNTLTQKAASLLESLHR